jgi:transcriptional regulator with XRE-family HTH domain
MNTKMKASDYLEKKYGKLSLGELIKSFRESDEISQTDFASKLNISRANLCDIEKGRKLVSPERAVRFAKVLKLPEQLFLKLALDDLLLQSNLKYKVELKAS